MDLNLNSIIIFVGPTLKGFEITDKIQKGMALYLEKRFAGRLVIYKTNEDISRKSPPRLRRDAQKEINKILEMAQDLRKFILIECRSINYPKQLFHTELHPIIVYFKIPHMTVLEKLIKTRKKCERKKLSTQVESSHKLALIEKEKPESFTITITDSIFENASDYLSTYLEAFWKKKFPDLGHLAPIPPKPDLNDKEKDVRIASGMTMVENMANLAIQLKSVQAYKSPGGAAAITQEIEQDNNNVVKRTATAAGSKMSPSPNPIPSHLHAIYEERDTSGYPNPYPYQLHRDNKSVSFRTPIHENAVNSGHDHSHSHKYKQTEEHLYSYV